MGTLGTHWGLIGVFMGHWGVSMGSMVSLGHYGVSVALWGQWGLYGALGSHWGLYGFSGAALVTHSDPPPPYLPPPQVLPRPTSVGGTPRGRWMGLGVPGVGGGGWREALERWWRRRPPR